MRKSNALLIALIGLSFTLSAQNAPIDFEATGNGADWTWTVFENGSNPSLEFIANPDPSGVNTSETVAQFTALQVGAPFAGCESMHGSDIGTYTIDEDNMMIRIMVWKSVISDVGIKLVREDNWSLGEIKIANTLTNQWEQITFDFSSHIGLVYDQIVIFPDFDARTSDNVIYFDNIMGPEAIATGLDELSESTFSLSPNPVTDMLSIQSEANIEEVNIFDLRGELVLRNAPETSGAIHRTDVSLLPAGAYQVQVVSKGNATTQRVIKL